MATDGSAVGRLRAMLRAVPIDVIAFVVIAAVMVLSHLRYVRTGMAFNDPSWYFHFGQRTLQGAIPYRDYIFQVGPLPVFVDAGFQEIFGERYVASLYAGLLIKVLRVYVIWLIVRRIANARAAAALCVFCAIDPMFAFAHHWSTAYAQLFFTLSGLFLFLASRAENRRVLLYLALAGFSAALVVSARQSTAVMIGVMMFPATAILLYRKEFFTPRRFIALWGGFAAAMVLVFGALALMGALGPAIQQLFLDAPAKKNVNGVAAVLDAISGGALIDWSFTWWGGFLTFIGVPLVTVIASVYLLARDREIELRTIGILVVPVALVIGLVTRYATFNFFSDVPRTFLSLTTVFALLFPAHARRWLGLEPVVLLGLGALPLASDWALEMSYPGRGWGDAPSLVIGVLLIVLASPRLASRIKTGMCIALGLAALLHFAIVVRDRNPLAKDEASDGGWRDNRHRSKHPILRGMKVSQARKQAVDWLTSQIPRGSTCFIYGNLPVLYDLIGCINPTRVDSTAADFITAGDAEAALVTLRANPPEFLVAHEKQWMSPALSQDLGGDITRYDSINPKASMAMHVGLRGILDQYESIGTVAEVLGPDLAAKASGGWDVFDATRIYRRKAR